MNGEDQIFDFERDFVGTLHCIPMSARLKLDLCGIKLSLKQWNHFELQDRLQLIKRPGRSPGEIAAWRGLLILLIDIRAGQRAVELSIDPNPPRADCSVVPTSITTQATALGLTPPSQRCWAKLSPFQRFTLIKLSGSGHDNDKFGPALREFGISEPS